MSPLRVLVAPDRATAEKLCAREIARALQSARRDHEPVVACFPWGNTFARENESAGIYDELSRSADGRKALARCVALAGDEWMLPATDPRSGRAFLERNLFSRARAAEVHSFDGTAKDALEECARYEALIRKLGGIDVVILGVGPNGHVLFNEPRRALEPGAHEAKPLGTYPSIPSSTRALTLGMEHLIQPRFGIVAAFGEAKVRALHNGLSGRVEPGSPVSYLQLGNYVLVTDQQTAKSAGLEELAARSGFTFESSIVSRTSPTLDLMVPVGGSRSGEAFAPVSTRFARCALRLPIGPRPRERPRAVDVPTVPLEPNTVLDSGARFHLGVVTHNEALRATMRPEYSAESFASLERALSSLGTLEISALPTGLPQAAENRPGTGTEEYGYTGVWTRDTAFIASAWLQTGEPERAAQAMRSLNDFYATPSQMERIRNGIRAGFAGAELGNEDRPHIKFEGDPIRDLNYEWFHAQNDALGLFLEMSFRAARKGAMALTDEQLEPLALIAQYLDAIDYSTDKECGHWEEPGRKGGRVMASSLRCVIAGLQTLRRWMEEAPDRGARLDAALARAMEPMGVEPRVQFAPPSPALDRAIERGARALRRLLPLESRGRGIYHRTSDMALVTALYLDVLAEKRDRLITPAMRKEILTRFQRELRGSHGDRLYRGAGYWGSYRGEGKEDLAYKYRMGAGGLEERLASGLIIGGEAQFTMATPVLSAIHGLLFQETGDLDHLRAQTFELNRALGMVTGDQSPLGPGAIPEAYTRVRNAEGGNVWRYVENPLPLNQSKAHLRVAMHAMRKSLERGSG